MDLILTLSSSLRRQVTASGQAAAPRSRRPAPRCASRARRACRRGRRRGRRQARRRPRRRTRRSAAGRAAPSEMCVRGARGRAAGRSTEASGGAAGGAMDLCPVLSPSRVALVSARAMRAAPPRGALRSPPRARCCFVPYLFWGPWGAHQVWGVRTRIRTRNEPKSSQGEVPGGRKTKLGAKLGIPDHPLRCYMARNGVSVPNFSTYRY